MSDLSYIHLVIFLDSVYPFHLTPLNSRTELRLSSTSLSGVETFMKNTVDFHLKKLKYFFFQSKFH